MIRKELKEMSTDEFIAQLKADANAELNYNVDEDLNQKKAEEDFEKFTKSVRKLKKIKTQLKELETLNKENKELQKYIKLLEDVKVVELELDEARKGYMYDSIVEANSTNFENKDVKLSITLPYERDEFNKEEFIKDYGPDTKMYKKYFEKKQVKGNVKYKIKEG